MLHKLIKGIAPVVAFAAACSIGGCDADVTINGEKGVPLAELETEGKTATAVVLAGPDTLLVSRGPALTIKASGDPEAVAALRFSLKDESLGVMRDPDAGEIAGTARVTVTIPALHKVVLAGSGTIEGAPLSGVAEVVIAGSGTARTDAVEATSLEVTIAGSGTYRASGKTDALELTIAGAGDADMAGLSVDTAEVTIAGSGSAAFASNGTVKATVLGSGEVTVTGDAKCTVKAMGSGTLRCSSAGAASAEAPTPPTPPSAPDAPGAPQTPAAPTAPRSPEAPQAPQAPETPE